ncbi:DsbA family protein [Microbispora sp. ATCC PTA-5024]|uniref:DsbA family protein n=1 Tax=Microbispora sp. ATCC PTA-5024 TaxID=316330 RepID=UPI0003DCDE31|nr:thioredoxin domain-containing protein [Microbispora sp. ATCC PTA-5024]ETK32786.1 hypothetical protein MPTA5024_27930 [Microbispora sp. ATCC PTA-5024]
MERRRRTLLMGLIGLVVVAAVVVGVLVQVGRTTATSFSGSLASVSVQQDGTVTMARAGVTTPVLDVYEDFQCPICKEFEHINGNLVKDYAARGKIKVVYHPIAFVNPEGSVRAAAAAQCVPGGSWMSFHDILFARQPDEKVALTVADLTSLAADAKITDAGVLSCMKSQRFASQAQDRTRKAFSSPDVQGTPTLLIDGRKLSDDEVLTSSGLRAALQRATA